MEEVGETGLEFENIVKQSEGVPYGVYSNYRLIISNFFSDGANIQGGVEKVRNIVEVV